MSNELLLMLSLLALFAALWGIISLMDERERERED